MLTADLVRATVSRGLVRPSWVNCDDDALCALAERLISAFEQAIGRPRRELQSELDDLLGDETDFLLHRGLAKLLFDRSQFATEAARDPEELRRDVFRAAATRHRASEFGTGIGSGLLEHVAGAVGLSSELIASSLFADLREEQRLHRFEPSSPRQLLEKYNTALAQAVLLRATRLDIKLEPQNPLRYRELFRSIKFHRLLHSTSGTARDGYQIHLDGPLSLFRASQRYGLQMATFLPTLLAFEGWYLEAQVLWGKRRVPRRFELAPSDGLRSNRHLRGQWQPEEIGWLLDRFPKLESDWEIESDAGLVDLGGSGVLIPDFVFTHRPSGRRVLFEIFGFWRKGSLASRLELLRRTGVRDVLLAVSRELAVDETLLEGIPAEVYVFRHQPGARDVLERLEQMLS